MRFDELLSAMARLGERDYSQVGVPMFLVVEDLRSSQPAPIETAPAWPAIAARFERDAEVLAAHKPDLCDGDVARLAEVLADRNLLGEDRRFSDLADASDRGADQ